MNAKLKNTRETVLDENSMSLELKCKMLEEALSRSRETGSYFIEIYINAQNKVFELETELNEVKYPSSHKVRHLKVLRG